MKISDQDLSEFQTHLQSKNGDDLMSALAFWATEGSKIAKNSDVFQKATQAGWIDDLGGLTTLGQTLADACRELLFWRDRDGVLAWEHLGEPLASVDYTGKAVVEIGSGMGVNLVTLNKRADTVIGVEPVEAYKQAGAILWDKAGEDRPEIVVGGGEATGLEAQSADIVLCVSSLQYCDIAALIDEIARIIKPNGQLVIYGDTFAEYLGHVFGTRQFGVRAGVTLTNSLSYSLIQRRIFAARGALSTTRPVYPVYGRLKAWLGKAGFEAVTQTSVQGECLVLARKTG